MAEYPHYTDEQIEELKKTFANATTDVHRDMPMGWSSTTRPITIGSTAT